MNQPFSDVVQIHIDHEISKLMFDVRKLVRHQLEWIVPRYVIHCFIKHLRLVFIIQLSFQSIQNILQCVVFTFLILASLYQSMISILLNGLVAHICGFRTCKENIK